MRIGRFEFKPNMWPTVMALLLITSFTALGFWQIWRGDQKRLILVNAEQRQKLPALDITGMTVNLNETRYRQVIVKGKFETSYCIYLDNKIYRGAPGYQVLVPLKISGTNAYVLINRGWIAMGTVRGKLPAIPIPADEISVKGMLQIPGIDVGKFGGGNRSNTGWPALYRWIDILSMAAETGLPLKPYVILEQPEQSNGLIQDWPLISGSPDKNYAYALQWFTFAAIVLLLWVKLNLKRIDTQVESHE